MLIPAALAVPASTRTWSSSSRLWSGSFRPEVGARHELLLFTALAQQHEMLAAVHRRAGSVPAGIATTAKRPGSGLSSVPTR